MNPCLLNKNIAYVAVVKVANHFATIEVNLLVNKVEIVSRPIFDQQQAEELAVEYANEHDLKFIEGEFNYKHKFVSLMFKNSSYFPAIYGSASIEVIDGFQNYRFDCLKKEETVCLAFKVAQNLQLPFRPSLGGYIISLPKEKDEIKTEGHSLFNFDD